MIPGWVKVMLFVAAKYNRPVARLSLKRFTCPDAAPTP